jgi:large subunit ribosomal protein L46
MSVRTAARAVAQAEKGPANVLAGLILSRVPVVTPELTDFEKAYYNYQSELERRLMWTFPDYFYFKKGSLAQRRFNAANRGPMHAHKGIYYPRGTPEVQHNRDRRFKQEVVIPRDDSEDMSNLFGGDGGKDSLSRPIVTNPRITEADKTNDTTSLIRKLERTLYLVTKLPGEQWKFPSFELRKNETLHRAAIRGLWKLGGDNMNTWVVSNTPAAVVRFDDGQVVPQTSDNTLREFYIKAHILHGQFVPKKSKNAEFAWLTKEEVAERVDKDYFNQLSVVLNDQ